MEKIDYESGQIRKTLIFQFLVAVRVHLKHTLNSNNSIFMRTEKELVFTLYAIHPQVCSWSMMGGKAQLNPSTKQPMKS